MGEQNYDGSGILQQLAAQAWSAALNTVSAIAADRVEYGYWKKQYGIQRKDQLSDRAYAEQRQDQLLQYASPTQEVDRLKDAGLNPALAFGGSPAPSPSLPSGSVPNPHGIDVQFPQISPVDVLGFQKLRNDREIAQQNLSLNRESIASENNLRFAQAQLALKNLGLVDEQTMRQRIENQFLDSTFQLRYQQLENDVALSSEQFRKMGLENSLIAADVDRIPLVTRKLQSEVRNILADTSLKQDQKSKLCQDVIESQSRTFLNGIEADYRDELNKIEIAYKNSELSEQQYRESKKKVTHGLSVAKDIVGMIGQTVSDGVKVYGAIASHGMSAALEHQTGSETVYIGKDGEIIGGTKKSYTYEPQKRK